MSSIDSSIDVYEIGEEMQSSLHIELEDGEPRNWRVDISNDGNHLTYGTIDLFIDSARCKDWRIVLEKQKFIQV